MDLQKFLPIKDTIISYWHFSDSFNRNKSLSTIIIKPANIVEVLTFLQLSSSFRMNCLTDIFCVDNFSEFYRFEINYNLLSTFYNERITIKVFLELNQSLESCSDIFCGANWLEREIWDLYGVFFSNHPDLRRILTDYGFDGHPMRKDFPLSGYFEVRYDDDSRKVLLEPVQLTQEFRYFDFISPWENK